MTSQLSPESVPCSALHSMRFLCFKYCDICQNIIVVIDETSIFSFWWTSLFEKADHALLGCTNCFLVVQTPQSLFYFCFICLRFMAFIHSYPFIIDAINA